MNEQLHEQLLRVVYAEWTIAVLLTIATVVCFTRNRQTSYRFFPLLGVSYVAALHGVLFINDGSGDPSGFATFGILFGLFLGAPIGAVLMLVLRCITDRQK